jgi:hypothetical protein
LLNHNYPQVSENNADLMVSALGISKKNKNVGVKNSRVSGSRHRKLKFCKLHATQPK